MAATTITDVTTHAAPKMHGPVTWYIRGQQNNWNWKRSEDEEEIEYQTRFPAKHLAHVHKGADASAPLLATIKTEKYSWKAEIAFPSTGDSAMACQTSLTMDNIAEEDFTNRWPVKVLALGERELHWQYQHPVQGNRPLYLEDPVTKEVLGDSNDNYLALRRELPEAAIEELVITGTAAQIMLAGLMHNDMAIAVEGPEGRSQWKYQERNWWDDEESEEVEEEEG